MEEDKVIIGPNGQRLSSNEDSKTARTVERHQEDKEYTSVIIKRSDEATRHPDDILEHAIQEGLEQYERPNISLFLSAISAGLIIGFAGMCVALISQLIPSATNFMLNRLIVALVYPLGFIICILSGTQLFTEQTATAVYPVLDKQISYKPLIKLWLLVLSGNFVGTFGTSVLLYLSDSVILAGVGFIDVGHHLLQYSSTEVFISAILAGWLMAQGGWLVMATPPNSSQIICIFIVTFIIGLGGLHHSIAGSAEIFSYLFHSPHPDFIGSLRFIICAVLGNLIGGSFFVGVLNYAHIKKSQ